MNNPIICAIDTKDLEKAKELCKSVKDNVGMVKCGLEFFTKNGPQAVQEIKDIGIPIFLDLKFHDIPNTVAEAIRSAIHLNVSIITIHTLGGKEMMQQAALAAKEEAIKLGIQAPLIIGVTVLTSMNNSDLQSIGLMHESAKQVKLLAKLAQESGLDGIVCSPHEIKTVKETCGENFKTIVPGIRPTTSDSNDQKRIMTPKEAIDNGADYIVIGRPITKSDDPAKAASKIYNSL